MLEATLTCNNFMIWFSSIGGTVTPSEELMRIVSYLFHLLLLIYMRDHIIKLESYYDERTTSLSDFTVIIKNIPNCENLKQKMSEFFLNEFKKPHIIKEIILLPEPADIDILLK